MRKISADGKTPKEFWATSDAAKLFRRFPTGKFGTIMVDCPWTFGNTSTRAAARNHYKTLEFEHLQHLPVASLAPSTGAHLYAWTTAAHIEQALALMKLWGFTYKMNLVWVKQRTVYIADGKPWVTKLQIGLGNYFRHAHELCLFGVSGRCPAQVHNLPSVIFAPRQEHSAKPPAFLEAAEKLSPGPRVELFARSRREGWISWGAQLR